MSGAFNREFPMSQRYLSGIQATGVPHIGNYIGAIRNWVASQDTDAEAFYMIADFHAITVPTDRETMRDNRLGAMAGLIGCGLDPARTTLFFQSQVPQHAEFAWLLSSQAYWGELNRMTQFKAKSAAGKDGANLALFAYPVLQAADILLYQTDFVPVGEDQVQHVELTRNIAQRLNGRYGETVKVPEAVVPQVGGRVMDLQQPAKKMSKSGNESVQGVVFLTDEDDAIARKVGRAVTDSLGQATLSDDQPGLKNLLTILAALDGVSVEETARPFAGGGYGAIKKALTERLVATLGPIRARIHELMADPAELERTLAPSRERARAAADATLEAVKASMGF
ncbi:MAG: tryptophanyl-tRNA synthetase [Sphingomonadales bacterium]|jgi:tryptophanyl-tRNA synthetase|nr:tryptophanyl-tRNA synthetase [Sphingomonadales bacterium]